MSSQDSMKRVRDYLNQHIDDCITAEDLASVSGYSFFHFCHLFTSVTGQSVAAYLRRRRLELAAEDLLAGESVSSISQKRGFETVSGFSKAFRRHYGITPTEYRTTRGGLAAMEPEIRQLGSFLAVGYNLAPPEGDFNVQDTGAYWAGNDFSSSVSEENYARLDAAHLGEVGMWMRPDRVSGEFYYFFGPVVKDGGYIPCGMELLRIPAAEYAVFSVPFSSTLEGLKENVRRVWRYIFLDWLESCPYIMDESKTDFEYYIDGKSYIYVPVAPRKK